jgi:replicative DNA helicase
MLLQGATEENVLTLLAWSEQHASALTLRLEAALFSTRTYRKIAELAIAHIQRYGKPPQTHLRDMLEETLRKGEEGKLLRMTLDIMEDLHKDLQPDFVLDELDRFIRKRRLSMAIEQASDKLQGDDIAGAEEALYAQDLAEVPSLPGIWLSDPDAMLAFMEKREDDYFSSGVMALDDRGVRPKRKTLWVFIAPPKKGKTWHLVQMGKHALMHGRKVLHITLENSAELTAQRYVQALFAMTEQAVATIRIPTFTRDSLGHCVGIDFDTLTPDSLDNASRAKLADRLRALKTRARFLIKEFPTGTLTMPQLTAFLDSLKRQENFTPDLLIIDYPDLMKLNRDQIRTDTGRLFVELRGIGVARNMAVAAVTQGNRASASARVVNGQMVAEDFSKIATADTILAYSQTGEEKELGLARVLVDGARGAGDKYIVMISQSYATGQFCVDSVYMNKHIETEVDRLAGGGDDRDE